VRALADVATISILQQRTAVHADLVQTQLQHALDSRVIVEQAKGFLAHTHHVGLDPAFALLRTYARSHQARIGDVARDVVERRIVIPRADSPDAGATVPGPGSRAAAGPGHQARGGRDAR